MSRATKRNVDIIIGRGLITAEAIAAELRRRLVKVLADNRRRLTIDRLLDLVRRTLQEFEPLLAKNLANAQLASWIIGADSIAKRLPKHVVKQLAAMNLGLPPNADLPPISIPPGGAYILQPTRRGDPLIRFPVIDKAVKDLTTRRVVTRPVFDRLSEEFKRQAFTVAYLDDTKTINSLREALVEDIHEGTSLQGFRDKVKERLGASPIGSSHLNNVYRTNIQSAFTGGHETIARNPIVKATFPYARYTAIDDGRVRDEHLALMSLGIDGTNIYRTDDPMWQLFLPPWHFQCRCARTLMTIRQAAQMGLKEAQRWLESGEEPPLVSRLPFIPFRPDPSFVGGGRFVA